MALPARSRAGAPASGHPGRGAGAVGAAPDAAVRRGPRHRRASLAPARPRRCRGIELYARRQRSMRTWASVRVVQISGLRHSSRSVPVKDSPSPFSQGLPGSMPSVGTPSRRSQDRTAVAVNAGAWSQRRELGGPCRTKSAVRRARTSSDRRRRATAMLRHARVCSFTMVRNRRGRPSCVRSRTQSSDQTGFGRSARRRVQEPSVAQRRRRRRGLRGTRRSSWRQRRSTRLWFTRQPSARSRAVMRREP